MDKESGGLDRIAKAIRLLREEARLNQSQAAKAASLSRQQWSDYEAGKAVPGTENLLRALAGMGKTLTDLDEVQRRIGEGESQEEILERRQTRLVLSRLELSENAKDAALAALHAKVEHLVGVVEGLQKGALPDE